MGTLSASRSLRRTADCTHQSQESRRGSAGPASSSDAPGDAPERALRSLDQTPRRLPRTKRSADASRSPCIWLWFSSSSSAHSICSVVCTRSARCCVPDVLEGLAQDVVEDLAVRRRRVEDVAPVGQQVGELLVPAVAGRIGVAQDRLGDGHGLDLGSARGRRPDGERGQGVGRRAGAGSTP